MKYYASEIRIIKKNRVVKLHPKMQDIKNSELFFKSYFGRILLEECNLYKKST